MAGASPVCLQTLTLKPLCIWGVLCLESTTKNEYTLDLFFVLM